MISAKKPLEFIVHQLNPRHDLDWMKPIPIDKISLSRVLISTVKVAARAGLGGLYIVNPIASSIATAAGADPDLAESVGKYSGFAYNVLDLGYYLYKFFRYYRSSKELHYNPYLEW